MYHKNKKYLKPYRKALRKKMTPAEIILWHMLRNRQLDGFRFFRQYSIGNYIVDFYCPKCKLAIELDGDIHFNEIIIAQDKIRTDYLNTQGVRVLRFENFEIYDYPQRTLDTIKNYLYTDENPENLLHIS